MGVVVEARFVDFVDFVDFQQRVTCFLFALLSHENPDLYRTVPYSTVQYGKYYSFTRVAIVMRILTYNAKSKRTRRIRTPSQ